MSHQDYRKYHNQHMHSNGASAYETLGGVLPSFTYLFIGVTFVSLLKSYVTDKIMFPFFIDFVVIIVPTILHITLLSNYIKELILSTIVVIVSLIILINSFRDVKKSKKEVTSVCRQSFITNYRSAVNLSSVIAILAVDFQLFPRRFAKTESFGFSLMDVGVGLFMIANGIVAPELRGKYDSVKKTFKSSIPLFVLGAARFFLTKETDYNVPVSEYGVHWNFFITLAVTKIFTSLIMNVIRVEYIWINAIFLIIAHETLLQTGLQNFALADVKRTNFVIANKEGLVSSLGYVSLYLFSVYFGYWLNVKKFSGNEILKGFKIFAISSVMLALTLITENYFGISRRLANSSYCFWMLFLGTFMIGLFYVGETIEKRIFNSKLQHCVYTPYIFEAISYNGLPFFLISNVLTGLINITLSTWSISNGLSFFIIVTYMIVSCFIICILYEKEIKLKL